MTKPKSVATVTIASKPSSTWMNAQVVAAQQRPPWPPPVQLEMHSPGIQLRPVPWSSFYCHAAWVQWIKPLVVADDILPKPPWLAFDPETLFKVDCSCSNTRASLQYALQLSLDGGFIQSQCYLSGATCKFMWLLVLFQYISNCCWPLTAHTVELLMIDFTWEEDRILPRPPLKIWHGFTGVHSIVAAYGPSVVPSSRVPGDPGECWKLWLKSRQSAVQVAELIDFKLTCSWLRLHMFQMFPSGYTCIPCASHS